MAATQNTLALLKNQDLQVAKISGTSFSMAHKMGLVRITLGTKQVNTTYTDYINSDGTDGITNSTQITITASNAFSGKLPTLYSGKYYYIGETGTKPSFATSSTGIRKWNNITPTSNLVASTIVDLTAAVAWSNNYFYKAYAYSTVAAEQTFSAQANTTYKMECWGSVGQTVSGSTTPYIERANFYGGKGGYSKGYIRFSSNRTLYLYTGDYNQYSESGNTFNGGVVTTGGGGNAGGGTDIRLTGGEWSLFAGFKSRIIVAGGGGGPGRRTQWYGDGDGGYAGGLTGGTGEVVNHDRSKQPNNDYWGYCLCSGGGQTAGGTCVYTDFPDGFYNTTGHSWFEGNGQHCTGAEGRFGHGIYGRSHTKTTLVTQGTGGGGWYAGASGFHSAGGGGSGFISGYPGCVAIDQTSSTDEDHMVHKTGTNCERYDNTYYFTNFTGVYHNDNMALKGGNESFPSPAGSLTGNGTETGHNDTGYIIITECPLED